MSIPERAGWYDDPEDDSRLRYFDGIIWSDRTVPRHAPRQQAAPRPDAAGSTQPQGSPGADVFGRPTGGAPPVGQQPPQQWWPGPQQPQQSQPGQQPGWGGPQPPYGRDQQQTAEPTTEDGQPLASYLSRVGAYLIDALLLAVLNLLVSGWAWYLWMADYWAFAWDAARANDPERVNELTPEEILGFFDWQYLFIAMGLSLLLQVAYHVGFLATRSATPGKMLVGLSVRGVDGPGVIGVGTAFMRYLLPLGIAVLSLVPLVSYVIWIVSLVDLLWPLKDPQRQALHDKIAGTQVVRGKQPRPTSRDTPQHASS